LVYRAVELVGQAGSEDLRIVARVRGRDRF
jgi:hypothetical protein